MSASKRGPSYCYCGHSITFHALFEDVGRDGSAIATCARCACTRFEYDAERTRLEEEPPDSYKAAVEDAMTERRR